MLVFVSSLLLVIASLTGMASSATADDTNADSSTCTTQQAASGDCLWGIFDEPVADPQKAVVEQNAVAGTAGWDRTSAYVDQLADEGNPRADDLAAAADDAHQTAIGAAAKGKSKKKQTKSHKYVAQITQNNNGVGKATPPFRYDLDVTLTVYKCGSSCTSVNQTHFTTDFDIGGRPTLVANADWERQSGASFMTTNMKCELYKDVSLHTDPLEGTLNKCFNSITYRSTGFSLISNTVTVPNDNDSWMYVQWSFDFSINVSGAPSKHYEYESRRFYQTTKATDIHFPS